MQVRARSHIPHIEVVQATQAAPFPRMLFPVPRCHQSWAQAHQPAENDPRVHLALLTKHPQPEATSDLLLGPQGIPLSNQVIPLESGHPDPQPPRGLL